MEKKIRKQIAFRNTQGYEMINITFQISNHNYIAKITYRDILKMSINDPISTCFIADEIRGKINAR